jgi:predicted dehydrogenase
MKALVVGLGSAGIRHLNNLYRLGVRDLSVYRSRSKSPNLQCKLLGKGLKVYRDYEKALEDGPDAVVIANPTSLHVPFAIKALERGSHLFIEKPISDTLRGMEPLLRLARRKRKVAMVGCQLRFNPNLERIKKWIEDKTLGNILSVSVDVGQYLPSWHPWENYSKGYAARKDLGGGVILTLIHELDYVYWLFGPVKRVYALGGHLTPLKIDVEDTALISLWTEKGVPVHIRMDYWRDPAVRNMHIVGEKGEIFWNYHAGEARLVNKGVVIARSNVPRRWNRNSESLAIMKIFLNAINKKTPVRTTLKDGFDVLKIALAAKSSIANKKQYLLNNDI